MARYSSYFSLIILVLYSVNFANGFTLLHQNEQPNIPSDLSETQSLRQGSICFSSKDDISKKMIPVLQYQVTSATQFVFSFIVDSEMFVHVK